MDGSSTFHNKHALMARILTEDERQRVFLFGAPLTMPERKGLPGVPDVAAVVELILDVLKPHGGEGAVHEIRELVKSGDLGGAYREGFRQVQAWIGPEQANRLIREAVLKARAEPAALEPATSLRDEAWHLRPSVLALGQLLARKPNHFTPVLTTNFDPLIEVSIRRAGGNCFRTVLDVDGSIAKSSGDGVHVVYLHGYWAHGDTLHTQVQLGAVRPRLAKSLKSLLTKRTLVVLGYAGWDDVMVRTLKDVVEDQDEYPEIVWAFRESDPVALQRKYARVFDCLAQGYQRGRVHYYAGIDMHSLLVEMNERLSGPASSSRVPAPGIPVVESAKDELISIRLTDESGFERGEQSARTSAFLLLRARERGSRVKVKVVHAARPIAEQRRLELEDRTNRTADEEAEYRHMFKVADHLDQVVPLMESAIDLLLQNTDLTKGQYLSDEHLGEYIVGLRNRLFEGAPTLWGPRFTNPDWYRALGTPHRWWLWLSSSSGPTLLTNISVNDSEVTGREHYLRNDRGEMVLPSNAALDVYFLGTDTFWKVVLPAVACLLLTPKPSTHELGQHAWQLKNWFGCPMLPDRATQLTMDQVHRKRSLAPIGE